jgi:hypothetical protein
VKGIDVVLDAARRNRELFAWALIAFVAASLVVDFISLFTAAGFARNSAQLQVSFVDPLLTAALVVAVVLVSMGEAPTGRARMLVQSALGVMAAMLGLAVVAWLAGLTVDPFFVAGSVKATASLRFLVAVGLLGVAAWFAWMVLDAMPAQRRAPQAQQPPGAWGATEGGWHAGQSFPSPSHGDQPQPPGGYSEPSYPPQPHAQQPHPTHGHSAQPPTEQRWETEPTWHSAEPRWPQDPEAQPRHADVLHPDPQADPPTEQMSAVPAPERDVDASSEADRPSDQRPDDTGESREWWRPQ